MIKKLLPLLAVLALLGCGGPPLAHPVAADPTPGLKPAVPIITPYGNTINCVAGPGAVCVQR